MKIFLTGRPGSGKSTVLRRAINHLRDKGLKVGGIRTPEIRRGRKRLGFKVVDVYSGREGILAHIDQKTGPRVSKYRINIKDFEKVALPALYFAVRECEVICIDEISKMEFYSEEFKDKVYDILKSKMPVVATLHRKFVDKFKGYGQVIEVTRENRDELPRKICKLIKT